MERHSFRIVSGESPETIRKLYLSTKFPHHEIRWNYGILRSDYKNKKLFHFTIFWCLTLQILTNILTILKSPGSLLLKVSRMKVSSEEDSKTHNYLWQYCFRAKWNYVSLEFVDLFSLTNFQSTLSWKSFLTLS